MTDEMQDLNIHIKTPQEYQTLRLKHQINIIHISPYILPHPQEQDFLAVSTPTSKEDFLTLKTAQYRGTGGEFLDCHRVHPMAKKIVRFMSALLDICQQESENKVQLLKAWKIIHHLLNQVTYKF